MATKWNHIQETAIREWLRDAHEALGIKNLNAVVARLIDIDPGIDEGSAREFVYSRSVRSEERKQAILRAALVLLKADAERSLSRYDCSNTRDFLSSLLGESKALPARGSADYLDLVTHQWRSTFNSGSDALTSGIYHVVRRYKPFLPSRRREFSGYDWNDPVNHAVIFELFLLDAALMECLIVTAHMEVYHGSMSLNHEDILYGTMVHTLLGGGRANFRLFALKIEGKNLPVHSGISLKAGDTTRRPIASECIYMRIPEEHIDLYKAMQSLRNDSNGLGSGERAVLLRYLTEVPPNEPYNPNNPGPSWKRVKFVRDFPALTRLVRPEDGRRSLLREPSRALSMGNLIDISTSDEFPIFQWDE